MRLAMIGLYLGALALWLPLPLLLPLGFWPFMLGLMVLTAWGLALAPLTRQAEPSPGTRLRRLRRILRPQSRWRPHRRRLTTRR